MKSNSVLTLRRGALSHILALSDSHVVTRASRVWKATGLDFDTTTGHYEGFLPHSEAGEDVNDPFHPPTTFREVYHLAEGTSQEPQRTSEANHELSKDSGMSRRSIFHGVEKSLYDIRDYADFTSALAQLVQGGISAQEPFIWTEAGLSFQVLNACTWLGSFIAISAPGTA
ncbi:hypothetical protein CPB85DRAFT_760605 [Mucidula mucida]|nr:hypothetical protein CPB85DRAFT_760605 [Mucidula mucida]